MSNSSVAFMRNTPLIGLKLISQKVHDLFFTNSGGQIVQ